MFGKSLEILLIAALKNHLYKFDNQIRKQSNGGPTGLKLTGEVGDCIMIDWDKTLIKELEKIGIEPIIYARFKDDINLVVESVEKGSIIVDGEIIIDPEKKKTDEGKSDAKITVELIKGLAN